MYEDTSPRQIDRYHVLLRQMTPAQRARKAGELSEAVRVLALAGLRQRHPSASEAELRVRLAVRLFGRETARRLFREIPDDAI